MDSILNLEELAVFLSLCGAGCWVGALRVHHSPPWRESAVLKRVLLGAGGVLLQVPVVLVTIFQPPFVTSVYTVEPFSPERLMLEYGVVGAIFLGLVLLKRWLIPAPGAMRSFSRAADGFSSTSYSVNGCLSK